MAGLMQTSKHRTGLVIMKVLIALSTLLLVLPCQLANSASVHNPSPVVHSAFMDSHETVQSFRAPPPPSVSLDEGRYALAQKELFRANVAVGKNDFGLKPVFEQWPLHRSTAPDEATSSTENANQQAMGSETITSTTTTSRASTTVAKPTPNLNANTPVKDDSKNRSPPSMKTDSGDDSSPRKMTIEDWVSEQVSDHYEKPKGLYPSSPDQHPQARPAANRPGHIPKQTIWNNQQQQHQQQQQQNKGRLPLLGRIPHMTTPLKANRRIIEAGKVPGINNADAGRPLMNSSQKPSPMLSASSLLNKLGSGNSMWLDLLFRMLKFEHFVGSLDLETASNMALNVLREILREKLDKYLAQHPDLVKKWRPRFKAIIDAAEVWEDAAGIGKDGKSGENGATSNNKGRSMSAATTLDLDDLLLFTYHKMMESREAAMQNGEPFPETWERGLRLLVRLKRWLEENGGDAASEIHDRFGYSAFDTQNSKVDRMSPAGSGGTAAKRHSRPKLHSDFFGESAVASSREDVDDFSSDGGGMSPLMAMQQQANRRRLGARPPHHMAMRGTPMMTRRGDNVGGMFGFRNRQGGFGMDRNGGFLSSFLGGDTSDPVKKVAMVALTAFLAYAAYGAVTGTAAGERNSVNTTWIDGLVQWAQNGVADRLQNGRLGNFSQSSGKSPDTKFMVAKVTKARRRREAATEGPSSAVINKEGQQSLRGTETDQNSNLLTTPLTSDEFYLSVAGNREGYEDLLENSEAQPECLRRLACELAKETHSSLLDTGEERRNGVKLLHHLYIVGVGVRLGVEGLPELLQEVEEKIVDGQEVDCHEIAPLCTTILEGDEPESSISAATTPITIKSTSTTESTSQA